MPDLSLLPLYQCFKKVRALKIERVMYHPDHVEMIVEAPFAPIIESNEWASKHGVDSTGYYVVYEDGYTSWSPTKAFEEGYFKMGSRPEQTGHHVGEKVDLMQDSALFVIAAIDEDGRPQVLKRADFIEPQPFLPRVDRVILKRLDGQHITLRIKDTYPSDGGVSVIVE